MSAVFYAVIVLLAASLALVTLVQLLYMESQRLMARDLPALEFFKETLEDRIGLPVDRGALTFSLIKHTLLLAMALCFLAAHLGDTSPSWEVFLESALPAWLTMLAATYVVPQLIYRKTSGSWLLPLVPAFRICALVISPLVAALGFFQSLIELAHPGTRPAVSGTSTENIDALISAGEEEGLIEKEDRKLIQSVVAFGGKTVREVMTPRPTIVAIEATRSLEELRELVIEQQYSRLPVYEGTIDHVVGFVHVRDMFELSEDERKNRVVKELIRPIRYVPETKPVNDLLREMQQEGAQMVIVIDEYGNTAGLATMEDLVEEILGEIHDEHEPERDVYPEGDAYVMSGSLDLDRLEDLLGFRPQEETESTTVGGLVTEWMGHVPHAGEVVEREGIRIEVLAGNELRVNQVRVSKTEDSRVASRVT
jgi:putative hemolysin